MSSFKFNLNTPLGNFIVNITAGVQIFWEKINQNEIVQNRLKAFMMDSTRIPTKERDYCIINRIMINMEHILSLVSLINRDCAINSFS